MLQGFHPTLNSQEKRAQHIDVVLMQTNPTPSCPGCPLTSRCPVGPRSHTHGSWFPLVHVNALSGSWPASRCYQSSVAKQADAAPGRKSSVGPARKGHQCGQMRPSSTASDWTAVSLAATGWSWPPMQSRREKAAQRRGMRAGSKKLGLTTHYDLTPRGQTRTSTPCCPLLCQHAPTSWMDTGIRSRWRSWEREERKTAGQATNITSFLTRGRVLTFPLMTP